MVSNPTRLESIMTSQISSIHSPDKRLTLEFNAAGDILRFYERLEDGTAIDYFHRPEGNRNPMMHPWANRVEKGEFTFDGQPHVLRPLHGAENNALHGNWTQPWSLRARDDHKVVLEVACAAEDGIRNPARRTPYQYDARQVLTLTNDGLTVEMELTNRGATLPFGIGLHPFLPRPQDTVVKMAVSKMENTRADMIPDPAQPVVDAPAAWTLSEGFNISNKNLSPAARGFNHADLMDNSFPGVDPAKGATVTWPGFGAEGREMTVTASDNCTFGVIFVPGAANDAPAGQQSFFCLEFTTNGINMQNRPAGEAGGTVLKSGETLKASTRYSIRKMAHAR